MRHKLICSSSDIRAELLRQPCLPETVDYGVLVGITEVVESTMVLGGLWYNCE